MSQKRARLRALASLGLSIVILGALGPTASAASIEVSATIAAPAAIGTQAVISATSAIAATSTVGDLAGTIALGSQHRPLAPASATIAAPVTVAASTRVIALAETHLGARYQHGATGPRAFDCSGLVYRVFEDAALVGRSTACTAPPPSTLTSGPSTWSRPGTPNSATS